MQGKLLGVGHGKKLPGVNPVFFLEPHGGGGGAGVRRRYVGGHFAVCRRGTSVHSARVGVCNSLTALHCAVVDVLCARWWGPDG